MDAALHAISMTRFLKKTNPFLKLSIEMNKDIMYTDFKRYRQWFMLRLRCLQNFDYEMSPILQEFYSFKMGHTI